MLNLDTHILLHSLTGELTRNERKFLSRDGWGISAIVLWEIEKLHQVGRISIGLDDADLIRAIATVVIWPVNIEVCKAMRTLDFKSDPADELIAATSLVSGAKLLTRDRRILQSKIVPFAK